MPLTRKLNLEVGARTWRFHSDHDTTDGIPKRGGYFEPIPRISASKSKPPSTTPSLSTYSSKSAPPKSTASTDHLSQVHPTTPDTSQALRLADELAKIQLERKHIAQEKLKIEEANRQTQMALQHAEQIRQQLAEDGARAAEEEVHQMRLQQQELEEEKQRLFIEADQRFQQLRDELAMAEKRRREELDLWQKRHEHSLMLQSEAEAKAKAREAAEEARAMQRERDLQERATEIDRLKQDLMEDYKRTHDQLKRTQEEQLQKELEQARRKIEEETKARKELFEAESKAKLAEFDEKTQLVYQKQIDDHLRLGKETTQAIEQASAKAAQEFKEHSQALKNLRSVAGDSYQRSELSVPLTPSEPKAPSVTASRSVRSTSNHLKSHPSASKPPTPNQPNPNSTVVKNSTNPSEEEIRQRREAMRQKLFQNVFTPNYKRVHEWGIRSAPPPFPVPGLSPSTPYGSPGNRPRATSVGQVNLSTPFIPTSTIPGHLNPHQADPVRAITGSNQGLYSRAVNTLPLNEIPQAQMATRSSVIPSASPIPPSQSFNNSTRDPSSDPSNHHDHRHHQQNPNNSLPQIQHQDQRQIERTHQPHYHQKQQPPKVDPQSLRHLQYKESVYSQDDSTIPATTMTTIPGYDITEVFGLVYGLALRDSTKEQNEKSIAQERKQAMVKMWTQAERVGANFVIGLKFQSAPVSHAVTEITAYGTAVVMAPSTHAIRILPNPSEHVKQTSTENQNPTSKAGLPSNKPNKGQKGTGGATDGQTNKNKAKGKRNDQNNTQNVHNSLANVNCSDSSGNVENNQNDQQLMGDCNDSWSGWPTGDPTWGTKNEESQKKKSKASKKQAQPAESQAVSTFCGWGIDSETPCNVDGDVGGHEADAQNGPKKGQKGQKGNKNEGESQKNKSDHKNGSKASKQNKQQPNVSNADPASQSQGGGGPMGPSSMMAQPPQPVDCHPTSNLPLVTSNRPWHLSGPIRNGFEDPRYIYPYHHHPHHLNPYGHEYFARRGGGGYNLPPLHPHHPPFDIYGPLLPPQYGPTPRTPMHLQWTNGSNGYNNQDSHHQHPGAEVWRGYQDHSPALKKSMNHAQSNTYAPPQTDRNTWSSNQPTSDSQRTSTQPTTESNTKLWVPWNGNSTTDDNVGRKNTKGNKVKHPASKNGEPSQTQNDHSWPNQDDNGSNSIEDSNPTTTQSTWNGNSYQAKKTNGGKGYSNKQSNSIEVQQRQDGMNSNNSKKSNKKQRKPPSPISTPSTSQDRDNDEEAEESEEESSEAGGLGLFSMMAY